MVFMNKNIRKITKIPERCRERYLPLEHSALAGLREAGIYFSGVSELFPGYRIGLPGPGTGHVIIFTLSGSGYFFTDDSPVRSLRENTFLAVPAGTGFEFGVKGNHWNIAWANLRDIDLWKHLHSGVRCEPVSIGPSIARAMEGCLAETAPSGDHWAAARYAELMIHGFKKALHTPETGSEFIRMEQLWENVRSRPSLNWTLKELAGQANSSPSTFQRRIKQFYGTTARQKLLQIRMEVARRLLENTGFPLKVVAARTGYADEFIFSTAFKRANGMPPRDFRRTKAAPFSKGWKKQPGKFQALGKSVEKVPDLGKKCRPDPPEKITRTQCGRCSSRCGRRFGRGCRSRRCRTAAWPVRRAWGRR